MSDVEPRLPCRDAGCGETTHSAGHPHTGPREWGQSVVVPPSLLDDAPAWDALCRAQSEAAVAALARRGLRLGPEVRIRVRWFRAERLPGWQVDRWVECEKGEAHHGVAEWFWLVEPVDARETRGEGSESAGAPGSGC